ncbi:MAG: hypothetical protein IJY25_00215 [Bacilli bacterium]|nr:hypothetical protein [Bacilli bacterium]
MNFKEEFINIINSNQDIKTVSFFRDEENCKNIIENNLFWNNIDLILKKFNQTVLATCIKLLSSYNPSFFTYDVVKIFNYSYTSGFYVDLFKYLDNSNLDLGVIFEYIIEKDCLNVSSYALFISMYNKKYKDLLYDNLDIILKNSYKLLKIKKIVSDNPLFLNKVDEFIENNPNIVIYNIIMDYTGMKKEEIETEKIFDFVKIIIDELLINENKKYTDIIYLGEGSSSVVYLIGDKVIKLGSERFPFKNANNKRFLRPILRTNIKSLKDDKVLFCIEITEKVDTNNITKEDARLIYEEFRDIGYVWGDVNPRNLGRLIKKNKIYFNEPLNPTKESINYTTENDIELDKGELVILDNEFIFEEKDFISKIGFDNANDLVKEFEARYQEEKKQKNY